MLPVLKYTVRHYGRNYSVISEISECDRLRFYATIESLYGANRFTVMVRKRNGNFSMTPTVLLLMFGTCRFVVALHIFLQD